MDFDQSGLFREFCSIREEIEEHLLQPPSVELQERVDVADVAGSVTLDDDFLSHQSELNQPHDFVYRSGHRPMRVRRNKAAILNNPLVEQVVSVEQEPFAGDENDLGHFLQLFQVVLAAESAELFRDFHIRLERAEHLVVYRLIYCPYPIARPNRECVTDNYA